MIRRSPVKSNTCCVLTLYIPPYCHSARTFLSPETGFYSLWRNWMSTLTLPIVLILQMCSIANQVHISVPTVSHWRDPISRTTFIVQPVHFHPFRGQKARRTSSTHHRLSHAKLFNSFQSLRFVSHYYMFHSWGNHCSHGLTQRSSHNLENKWNC